MSRLLARASAGEHRRASMNGVSGAVLLALHPQYEQEAARLQAAKAWQLDPAREPGLLDRVGSWMQRRSATQSQAVSPIAGDEDAEPMRGGFLLAGDVAIIPVQGVLTHKGYFDCFDEIWVNGYADIADAICEAQDHPAVAAVLLHIDSPGGVSNGCDELAEVIRANSMRAGMKPVVAYCVMAYSAAQEIAASCDATYASRGAGLGSIGVRLGWFDWSGMIKADGVVREEFVSGTFKDMGSPFRPVTPEERSMFQATVDAHAQFFFEAVAIGRELDIETVRGWQARTFTAGAPGDLDPQAAGLLDAVMTESDAFEAARLMADLTPTSVSADGRADTQTVQAAAMSHQEMEMLEAQIAALRAKAANGDKEAVARLRSMGCSVKAPKSMDEGDKSKDEDAGAEGEADDEAEDEAEDEADDEADATDDAEEGAESDEADAEGDDEVEEETGAKAGSAIGAEAGKAGKPKFGAQLAAQVGAGEMSLTQARRLLSAAGRESSPVRDSLAPGRRGAPNAGGDGAPPESSAAAHLSKAHKRLNRGR